MATAAITTKEPLPTKAPCARSHGDHNERLGELSLAELSYLFNAYDALNTSSIAYETNSKAVTFSEVLAGHTDAVSTAMQSVAEAAKEARPRNSDERQDRTEILTRWAFRCGDFEAAALYAAEAVEDDGKEQRAYVWPALGLALDTLSMSQLVTLHETLCDTTRTLTHNANMPRNKEIIDIIDALWLHLKYTEEMLAERVASKPVGSAHDEELRLSVALQVAMDADDCAEQARGAADTFTANVGAAS